MTFGLPKCYTCSKNEGKIAPKHCGASTGPCKVYKSVPRDIFFEAVDCPNYSPTTQRTPKKTNAPPKKARAKSTAKKKTTGK